MYFIRCVAEFTKRKKNANMGRKMEEGEKNLIFVFDILKERKKKWVVFMCIWFLSLQILSNYNKISKTINKSFGY